MVSTGFTWLLCICIVQFLIILALLNKQYGGHQDHTTSKSDLMSSHVPTSLYSCNLTLSSGIPAEQLLIMNHSSQLTHTISPLKSPSGVAATLLLHAPTWFQRRYTMMIQNAVNNIPADWVVQIFYTTSGQSQKGLDVSPGIQRFIAEGKVVLTPIPKQVLAVKKKRFEMMFEPWIWESLLADTVLIFGGNAVICSNSPHSLVHFASFDYLGGPWDYKKGVGGDGGISIRSKQAMLAAIHYELSKVTDVTKKITAFQSWGQEDQFFVRTLLEMNQQKIYNTKNGQPWRLASRNDTLRFSAIGGAVNNDVLVVSGTLPNVPYDERQAFMSFCPEVKMFYPALHDPHCFGASPDAAGCAKNICALKDLKDRKGKGGC